MTAETLKRPAATVGQDIGRKHGTVRVVLRYTLYTLAVLGLIAFSAVEIWNSVRTSDLHHQVRLLSTELAELKQRINQFEHFESMSSMYDYPDSNLLPLPTDPAVNSDEDYKDDIDSDLSASHELDSDSDEDNNEFDEWKSNDTPFIDGQMYLDSVDQLKTRPVRSVESFISAEIENKAYHHREIAGKEFVNNAHFHRTIKEPLTPAAQLDRSYEYDRLDNASEHEIRDTDVHRPKSRRSRVFTSNSNEAPPSEHIPKHGKHAKNKSKSKKSHERKSRVLRHMRRNLETRGRTVSIQYEGDTSHLGITEHHRGNGLMRHHSGTYTNWKPASWASSLGTNRFFSIENGVVTVAENGLYHVYAQIYYHDGHTINSYHVARNNENVLQCTTSSSPSNTASATTTNYNTCHTSGLMHLRAGDTIQLIDTGTNRFSLLAAGKSFFGLIRVSDAREVIRDRNMDLL